MRFVDEGAAGIGTEQDDLVDPAVFFRIRLRTLNHASKLFMDDADDLFQFDLLCLRKMSDIRFHRLHHRFF
ncbi:hypothetical protein D3C72_2285830 [compost metagenome]